MPRRARTVPGVAVPRHLGDFGTPKAATVATFGYFGTQCRLNPALSELVFVDFMERAQDVDEKDPTAITMIKDIVREFVHPDDFDALWGAARVNGQDVSDLLVLIRELTVAAAGRPTMPRRDSSTGPARTAARSTDGSYERVRARLAGRPDLQLLIDRTHEARLAG